MWTLPLVELACVAEFLGISGQQVLVFLGAGGRNSAIAE